MYAAQLGRFVSRDPIGNVPGRTTADLGPSDVAQLDSPSPDGVDVLYSHEYVAERMRKRNLYGYAVNSPVSRVDPLGLKCQVAVHCRGANVLGTDSLVDHCGLSLLVDGVKYQLDGIGGDINQIREREGDSLYPEGKHGMTTGPFNTYSDAKCQCLRGYSAIFNPKMIPRYDTEGNSNWVLNCLVSHCGIKIDWKNKGAPLSYHTAPCKCFEYPMGVGAGPGRGRCIKRYKCP